MKKTAILDIKRICEGNNQTIGAGNLILDGEIIYTFFTLELPNLHNKRNISSIPVGIYKAEKILRSSNGKEAILLNDVPGRSEILLHSGNYYKDSEGCILAGDRLVDINSDGLCDVTNSNHTVGIIYNLIPDNYSLSVKISKIYC